MPKITELFAFIFADRDENDEGVAAFLSGSEWLPMVGADMKRIEAFRPVADTIARQTGKNYKIVRFRAIEEVELEGPPLPIDGLEFKIGEEKKMEKGITTQQMIGNLVRVGHKSLELYKEEGLKVVDQDPNLFAHLVAWNYQNGEIRDAKVALPVTALKGEPGGRKVYHNNAIAHLLLLDPRNLVRAIYFNKSWKNGTGSRTLLKYGIERYLRIREDKPGWWDRTALQHRDSLKTLYALNHIKPHPRAQGILFERKYPRDSVFEALRHLKNMAPDEAAGTILTHRIPFPIAIGALGGIKKNTGVILSLIENMSGAELITNSKMLSRLGVMENPALKSAYEKGIGKAQKDKRVSTLKAGRASEFIEDKKVKAKLEKLQEAKIDDLKGIEGDWLVLGDMSGSMSFAIEKAKEVAAFLSRAIKGNVYLVFFNDRPFLYDVSGKSLEEIQSQTSGIRAGGNTSIGCGLQLIMDKNIIVNGIAICSDGGENASPAFCLVYKTYEERMGISPNVYLLHIQGQDSDRLSVSARDIPYEKLEMSEIDYYGLPSLARVLRTTRYSLIDEILNSKLLTIDEVLNARTPDRQ